MAELLEQRYLEFIAGSSYKFYSVALVRNGSNFSAEYANGRIDAPNIKWTPFAGPDEAGARKGYAAKLLDKMGGGYQERDIPALRIHPTGAGGNAAASVAPARPTASTLSGVDALVAGLPPTFPAQNAAEGGDINLAIRRPDLFAVEEKFNGHRGLIAIGPGGIVIRNRYGQDKGKAANAVAVIAAVKALVARQPAIGAGTILDGELVASSWAATTHLLGSAGRTEAGLRFVVFDMPYAGGKDLRSAPWNVRRASLEQLAGSFTAPLEIAILLRPTATLVKDIWSRGGEGVIIKDVSAPYIPGARSAWSKVKEVITADAIILGFTGGYGKYAGGTGAVRLGQYKNGQLVEVVKISGMNDTIRASFDDSWIGRVVEFEHNGQTPNSYTNPRWLRVRDDKLAEDCDWDA